MTRKLLVLLVVLMLPLLTWAQTKVNASEIIAKINRGEAVSYKNAEIVGDLDMTKLQNMKLKKEVKNKYSSKEYISTVKTPLTFVNCTFTGNVLGYFTPGESENMLNSLNEVYSTNFEDDVRFENCTFRKKSAFKYSEFKKGANFTGSRFEEEALFKYTRFSETADFSDTQFSKEANFKYVEFPERANFAEATYQGEANYKYAKFERGVNFERSLFNGTANFKYAKVSESFNIKGASFSGSNDFKYTMLNNRKVTLASLQSSN